MIRAIGFDLWETLITDTTEIARRQEELRLSRLEQALSAAGHGEATGRLREAYHSLWDHCYELYWSGDVDIPTRQQIVHLIEKLDLDLDALSEETLRAFDHAYAAAAIDLLPEVVPHAPEVLRWAKDRGYKVGLISNTGRTPGWVLREVLLRQGLSQYIDAMVFSNEHGECKPRRSIFDKLCAALEIAPEEMIFVGDNLYVDVYGAKQCGMRAVHFVPPKRGLAVAPRDPGTDFEVLPDATVRTLSELQSTLADLAQ